MIRVTVYENHGNFRLEIHGHAERYVCGQLTGMAEALILLAQKLARDYPNEVKVVFR